VIRPALIDPEVAANRVLDELEGEQGIAFGEHARMRLAHAVGSAHEAAVAELRQHTLDLAARACAKVADAYARNERPKNRLSGLAAAEECSIAVRALASQASAPNSSTHVAASSMRAKTPENKGQASAHPCGWGTP
jgi:hypothetical protein